MNTSHKTILLTGLMVIGHNARSLNTKQAVGITMGAVVLRYALPPSYRLTRYTRFKLMSYENRLTYAREFYYKIANFYFEAVNKEQRNEADWQTIVSTGIQQVIESRTIGKRLWQWLDFEFLNRSKTREGLREKYPFLYYEDKLRNDIKWMDWYIDHLQVDGTQEYARKKQEMRNWVADLKRLHVEIKHSLNYQKELKEKKEIDIKIKQLKNGKY